MDVNMGKPGYSSMRQIGKWTKIILADRILQGSPRKMCSPKTRPSNPSFCGRPQDRKRINLQAVEHPDSPPPCCKKSPTNFVCCHEFAHRGVQWKINFELSAMMPWLAFGTGQQTAGAREIHLHKEGLWKKFKIIKYILHTHCTYVMHFSLKP